MNSALVRAERNMLPISQPSSVSPSASFERPRSLPRPSALMVRLLRGRPGRDRVEPSLAIRARVCCRREISESISDKSSEVFMP